MKGFSYEVNNFYKMIFEKIMISLGAFNVNLVTKTAKKFHLF